MAPLTLSEVGRVVLPSKVFSGRPPYFPATILIPSIIAKSHLKSNTRRLVAYSDEALLIRKTFEYLSILYKINIYFTWKLAEIFAKILTRMLPP
ncbi:Uncharacterised protein [Chlamydia trachomatis]|nr:Uncharacterised protein [Chlamydia trachomatis]